MNDYFNIPIKSKLYTSTDLILMVEYKVSI